MHSYISVQYRQSGIRHFQAPALSLPYLKTVPLQGTSSHSWTVNLPEVSWLLHHMYLSLMG